MLNTVVLESKTYLYTPLDLTLTIPKHLELENVVVVKKLVVLVLIYDQYMALR